jgi:hypothetical protein
VLEVMDSKDKRESIPLFLWFALFIYKCVRLADEASIVDNCLLHRITSRKQNFVIMQLNREEESQVSEAVERRKDEGLLPCMRENYYWNFFEWKRWDGEFIFSSVW